jgi:methylated-DNA-[protein]-cysteine S-methyltransferase
MGAAFDAKGRLLALDFLQPDITVPTQGRTGAGDQAFRFLRTQMEAYFRRTLRTFNVPLAPEGTEFQQRVWKALQEIPYGATLSYLELAKRLGDEKAIRAVGRANGANPIAILIPCHRVIGTDGALVGYAGGMERKRALLELEGVLRKEDKAPSLFEGF